MRRTSLFCAVLLAACGAAPAPAPHVARDEAPDEAPAIHDARTLGSAATFADLVAIAARQDHLRDSDSDAGCLLRTTRDGFRFDADLAVAVRPLPEVATELDARLETAPGPVRVLTRYGSYGETGALGATAITTTAPPAASPDATLLVLTDRGVYVRSTAQPSTSAGVQMVESVAAQVHATDTVFVTAEAGVPLGSLRALLAVLPAGLDGRVGLAVLLTDDTRLPAAATEPAGDDAPPCTEGLSVLADDAVLGELDGARILAGLAPLRTTAEICVGTTTGPGAAGGRVALDVRIGTGGRVTEACIREDSTGDGALRACLLRAARELAFDDPHGAVDFELPLVLAPGASHRQRALCE